MKYIQGDYFKTGFPSKFDGIITDIPYKRAIKNKLGEENFSILEFLIKADVDTVENSFLITFVNFRCAVDIINFCNECRWEYHTLMIWDKRPTRNWISWGYPLRHTEYIIFLKKDKFKFSFKDGTVKPAYKRKSFGGSLKTVKKENTNKYSYGMYSEIIQLPIPRNKIHPTEKPKEFSDMFAKIVGPDKFVLDPFVGSGNLLHSFNNSVGIDIKDYINVKNHE